MSSNTNNLSIRLQSLLDERKEELPDGLYKELCDQMLALNQEERKVEYADLYTVDYLYTGIRRESRNLHVLTLESNQEIVRIRSDIAAGILTELTTKSSISYHRCEHRFDLSYTNRSITLGFEASDEVRDEEGYDESNIMLQRQVSIIKITKI